MIKKSLFAEEIAASMDRELISHDKEDAMNKLENAVDYLHSAAEALEKANLLSQSNKVMNILEKIAMLDPRKINDPHTKGLTPDKMVKNMLDHGSMFNADDGKDDDLLNLDIGDEPIEVSDEDKTFEDE